MYCKNCGNYMDDNTQFCPNCGARQDVQNQQQNTRTVNGVPDAQPAQKIGFLDAFKMYFMKYTDFSTRSRRSEFWWAYLAIYIISQVIAMIAMNVEFLSWLPSLWSIAILVPGIAITVRRLHDVGHKGTYYLWFLLPLVGWIMILVQCCKDSVGDNEWGPSPKGYR